MNSTTCLAVALTCGFALSCTRSSVRRQQLHGQEIIVCDVEKIGSQTKPFPLGKIVESIETVRLQTSNDNSLIQRIKKISISEHHIGILDDGAGSKAYKLFNRKGEFLRLIGSVGQGPLEYLYLSDAQIDESGGKIYLMPFANVKELLCYNLDGMSARSIPLAYSPINKPKFFISGDTITCFQMPFNRSAFVFRQDFDGHIIDSIPATEQMYAMNYDGEIFVTQNTNSMEVFYTAMDTLFHYNADHNKLTPVFYAEFSQPILHIYKELPGYYLINGLKNVLINKKTFEAFHYELYNDFWEIPVQWVYYDHGHIILIYEADTLKQLIRERLLDSRITNKLKQQLTALDEMLMPDDNPVMMIGKLRSEDLI